MIVDRSTLDKHVQNIGVERDFALNVANQFYGVVKRFSNKHDLNSYRIDVHFPTIYKSGAWKGDLTKVVVRLNDMEFTIDVKVVKHEGASKKIMTINDSSYHCSNMTEVNNQILNLV